MFWSKKTKSNDRVASLESEIAKIKNESISLNDVDRLSELFSLKRTASGMTVTSEKAQTFSAVYRSKLLIASTIATMPFDIYKKTGEGRESGSDHAAYDVLHKSPSNIATKSVFWETLISDLPLAGDGIALIVRTRGGDLLGFIYIPRRSVQIIKRDDRLIYVVTFEDGKQKAFDQDDVLHIPNFGFDGKCGRSTISYAAESIGIGLSADEYSAEFFANGSAPDGHIEFDKKLTDATADFLLNYWESRHSGSGNRHRTGIIPEGGSWKTTTINAADSQLIETRRFQISDIARFFGVPLYLLHETDKSTSWGSGLEEQGKAFLTLTLQPYISRIEEEINRKIFSSKADADYFLEINPAGLLRADIKSRYEAYQIALGGNQQPGWAAVNEVRKKENMKPIDGGDEVYKPLTGQDETENTGDLNEE